jgi:hypothetical protein
MGEFNEIKDLSEPQEQFKEDQAQQEKKEKPADLRLFKGGQRIVVKRSNGDFEQGWMVQFYDNMRDKYLVVQDKPVDQNPVGKLVTEKDLFFWQGEARFDEVKDIKEEFDSLNLEDVDEKSAKEMLKKVEIHGSPYQGKNLTSELLAEEGILPNYKIKINGHDLWFSPLYEIGAGRKAVTAFVKKDEKLVARSFYLSNSQGVWRYLPEYQYSKEKEKISWYGKGYGEEGVTLPAVLQKALGDIDSKEEKLLEPKNPELIFAGTSYQQSFSSGVDASYYGQVESEPKVLDGETSFHYPLDETMFQIKKLAPEKIRLKNPEDEPDFSLPMSTCNQNNEIYGLITVQFFPSKNNLYIYTFCHDADGRAWIGSVEDRSPYQSVGLRKNWVSAGDLTTPAFEYWDQTGGYQNDEKKRGKYTDMFDNYLSRISIIQKYLKAPK